MRYQAALRPDVLLRLYRESVSIHCAGFPLPVKARPTARFDATIEREYGGYSSVAERLSVAQDVEGSIPSSRPNVQGPQGAP
jgi:hypothetical protein